MTAYRVSLRAVTAGLAASVLLFGVGCATGAGAFDAPRAAPVRHVHEGDESPAGDGRGPRALAYSPLCRTAKCIALTFDDGPGPYTARLLDILGREGVRATFFLVGDKPVHTYPDLVRRIAAQGHAIGNHTWTHPVLTGLPEAETLRQLALTQSALQRLTGVRPTLMRPPKGLTDARVTDAARALGLAQILWNVTATDYHHTTTELVRKLVLERARPGGVVLLHDVLKWTVPAVPGIITGLRAAGYTLVTVPQLYEDMRPGEQYPVWATAAGHG
ncbi:polysaccharide deacetylase family protein [Streptomyces sp. BPTC-684]|uniref:polysaccharide deacetylase family protein n=1 Tax=Streptomyces sp. BPTC-684 TaxID=3043734 RepID=UPI0024B0D4BE|nr:polysaccharide deacetylase family protein [Streptomyces sp. BPTC-684]WHM38162.1 polysaccharide deacetylase family protein [Streptomyces sp. BPTC-684]